MLQDRQTRGHGRKVQTVWVLLLTCCHRIRNLLEARGVFAGVGKRLLPGCSGIDCLANVRWNGKIKIPLPKKGRERCGEREQVISVRWTTWRVDASVQQFVERSHEADVRIAGQFFGGGDSVGHPGKIYPGCLCRLGIYGAVAYVECFRLVGF